MNEEKLDMIEENVPTSEMVEETAEETVVEEVAVSEEAQESIADSVKALSTTNTTSNVEGSSYSCSRVLIMWHIRHKLHTVKVSTQSTRRLNHGHTVSIQLIHEV